MILVSGFRRKPDRRPTPVVNLAEPVVYVTPELREPVLGPPIARDHETLALDAALDMGPLAAYWAATTGMDPSYAPAWAAWVKARRHARGLEGWLAYQDAEDARE